MRKVYRHSKNHGILFTIFLVIEVPLVFIRDYTCPMGEDDAWDRTRAAVVLVFYTPTFFFLNGLYIDDPNDLYLYIGLLSLIPGAILGIIVRFKTKVSEAPAWLMTTYSILAFV